MKKLYLLLLILLASSTYAQNRRVDTLFTKKLIQFDSVGTLGASSWGKGTIISRGAAGLYYGVGNAVTRIDSGLGGGGGGGITTLNGLTNTSQTFTNDSNVTISSSGGIHTIGFTGPLSTYRGGTGDTVARTLSGTSNQITVTGSGKVFGANMTLSLPQNIDSTANLALGKLTFPLGTEFLEWKNYSAGAGILIYPTTTPTSQLTMKLPTAGGTFVTNATSPLAVSTAGTVYLDGLGGATANYILGENSSNNGVEWKQFGSTSTIAVTHNTQLVSWALQPRSITAAYIDTQQIGLIEVDTTKIATLSSFPDTSTMVVWSDTLTNIASQYDLPVPVTSYIRSGVDSLAVTVPSVSKAMGSYADSRSVPPIPLKVYKLDATTVVLKVEYATPYDSLRVDWMYWR